MSVELCFLNGGPYYHPQIQIHDSKLQLMVRRVFFYIHVQLKFSDRSQDIPVAPIIGHVETDREGSTQEIVRTQAVCFFN